MKTKWSTVCAIYVWHYLHMMGGFKKCLIVQVAQIDCARMNCRFWEVPGSGWVTNWYSSSQESPLENNIYIYLVNGTKDTEGHFQAKKKNDINRYMNSQMSECLPIKQGDFQGLAHAEQPWFVYNSYHETIQRSTKQNPNMPRHYSYHLIFTIQKNGCWF